MKPRFVLLIAMSAALLVPLAGRTDIPDGVQCSQSGLGYVPIQRTPGRGDLDRFAICVTDGTSDNGAELYFGGEFQPDDPTDGKPCSALVVFGRTVYGDPDWYRLEHGQKVFDTSDDYVRTCQ